MKTKCMKSKELCDPFLEYLEYATKTVATWPKWKQNVLGGPKKLKKVSGKFR